jgi:hypothetical protein
MIPAHEGRDRGGHPQRGQVSVFISKGEHAFQVALVTVGKSASRSEGIGFLKGAE